MVTVSFENDIQRYKAHLESTFEVYLPTAEVMPARIHEAMRYAIFNGGKRLRAILVFMTGEMLGAPLSALAPPALAVELIHTYSLVHDDLPSMDDDDMRRNMPSCHVQFDEATAILVGDALQALAYQIISHDTGNCLRSDQRTKMVFTLAEAAGSTGLVGGQMMDLELQNNSAADIELDVMHSMKTGALINCAVQLGAIAANDVSDDDFEKLTVYGRSIGLAFQCVDDILDGENPGQSSKSKAAALRDRAIEALQGLEFNTDNLHQMADFFVERSY